MPDTPPLPSPLSRRAEIDFAPLGPSPLSRRAEIDFAPLGPFDTHSELECPRCGDDFLHQTSVGVYSRSEDDETTLVTSVMTENRRSPISVGVEPSVRCANPSLRRNGLSIAFSCENCGDGIALKIAQHKGRTQVFWEYGPPPPPEPLSEEFFEELMDPAAIYADADGVWL